jgi:hypothetical protein
MSQESVENTHGGIEAWNCGDHDGCYQSKGESRWES